MLQRSTAVDSQVRGMQILKHLFEMEAENNHEMGVFHFSEEMRVEEDVERLAMSKNRKVYLLAGELLQEFLDEQKEEFAQEFAVRRNSLKFDEEF